MNTEKSDPNLNAVLAELRQENHNLKQENRQLQNKLNDADSSARQLQIEHAQLRAKHQSLQEEKSAFKARLEASEQEMSALRKEHEKLKLEVANQKITAPELSDTKKRILGLLSTVRGFVSPQQVAQHLRIHPVEAEQSLYELSQADYLEQPFIQFENQPQYQLGAKGRRFVLDNNLIHGSGAADGDDSGVPTLL